MNAMFYDRSLICFPSVSSLNQCISTLQYIASLPLSILSRNNAPQQPKWIQKIHDDITAFEDKLQMHPWYFADVNNDLVLWELGVFRKQDIRNKPEQFLQYCYYQKYHSTEKEVTIEMLDNDPIFLNKCRNTRINDYSALGAALLAKNSNNEDTSIVINKLLERGFIPTKKDKEIVQWHLYKTITEKHITAITFLFSHHSYVAQLPHEIKRLIMHYTTNTIKNYLLKTKKSPFCIGAFF